MSNYFISVREAVQFLQPAQILPDAEGDQDTLIDKIGISDFEIVEAISKTTVKLTVVYTEELILKFPGIDQFSIAFFLQDEETEIPIEVDVYKTFELRIPDINIAIRLAQNLLYHVEKQENKWVKYLNEDNSEKPFQITIDKIGLKLDRQFSLSLLNNTATELNILPFAIGDSGIVVECGPIQLYFDNTLPPPPEQDLGFQGIYIETAKIYLPDGLAGIIPDDLTFQHCAISSGGFSGTVAANWDTPLSRELFGIVFQLKEVSIDIKQNSITEFEITGGLLLPFFDKLIDVTIGIDAGGGFIVGLSSESGLVELEITDVLKIEISSLAFELKDGIFTTVIAGKLTPLIAGLDWPAFDIQELSIDSEGNVKLEGGWLNLPNQYSLDFYGFQFEIVQIGFGKNNDGSKWVGFSGGLKLVDGLQAGASVEGLKITWGNGDPSISFNGIGVEFEVEGAVRFKGEVSYKEFEQVNPVTSEQETVRRFDGAIALELIALNMQIDAVLVIGTALQDGESYNFFAIYLGVELPAGIPIFQTGLGIYGMAGLFAIQMEPNKLPDEPWYGIGDGEGWYKRPEIGVTDLKNKWVNVKDSLALGAGITIGTLPDNGFNFSGKFLLVLILPGPILMLEGKANILKDRSKLDEEPIFRALAVLDGREGSFLFGLDAQYKFGNGGELIDIHGGVEAFFSFSDPQAWHLYIGKNEPRESRIRAEIFQLFEANSYLMLNAQELAMGAWVGYNKNWKFGPLKVIFEAWLEGNAKVSFNPAFFYGDVWAHGKAELSVYGFGLGLNIDARLASQVFDPFWIKGEFSVGIGLPWPLPDFDVDITLEWGPRKDPPAIPEPLKEIAVEHFKVSSSWIPELYPGNAVPNGAPQGHSIDWLPALTAIPVVPLDARPHITFGRSVHDINLIGVNVNDPSPAFEMIGDPEKNEGPIKVKYKVDNTVLQKLEGGIFQDIAAKNIVGVDDIFGSWAPMPGTTPDPASLSNTKLWLWSKTPYDYSHQIDRSWDEWFVDTYDNYPCPPPPKPVKTCYNFENVPLDEAMALSYTHPANDDLKFYWFSPTVQFVSVLSNPILNFRKALCFPVKNNSELVKIDTNYVWISLPVGVKEVELTLRSESGVEVRAYELKVDGSYEVLDATITGDGSADSPQVAVQFNSNSIKLVLIKPKSAFCLAQVCTLQAPLQEDTDRYQEIVSHLQEEMGRWSQEGKILDPYSIYRLKVKTSYESLAADGAYAGDADFEKTNDFEHFIYFRTEGPPGLVALSPPSDASAGSSGNNQAEALQTLELYVKQTIPATVAAKGEKPLLTKPVYRAYDIGVEFNEDYVDLMYKIAGRDLGLYLFDNNNQPVRDASGKLIVLNNEWGRTETLSLLEGESQYISQLNEGSCVDIDTSIIPKDSTLTSLSKGQVLESDTVYQARLVPLLFQESFSKDKGYWQIDTAGTINGPAHWTWVNHEDIKGQGVTQSENVLTLLGNPDLSLLDTSLDSIYIDKDTARFNKSYRLLSVDNATKQVTLDAKPAILDLTTTWLIPAQGTLVQTANIYGGSQDGNDPVKPGTIYFLKNRVELAEEDQPSNWTDYRLSVVLRSADDDAIGVVFRYSNNTTLAYYRFSMDKQRNYRRLVRVVDDVHTILYEDKFVYEQNIDYLISIEALGTSIKIYQDGEKISNVTDDVIEKGSIGLYCWGNTSSRFNEVRLDDYRQSAPIVYTFDFVSGLYANFYHQVHSYNDELWPQSVPDTTNLDTYLLAASSLTAAVTEEEFRLYDSLANELLGPAATQLTPELQVSHLIQQNEIKGWLLQNPEPLLWERIDARLQKATGKITKEGVPGWLKLTGINFSETDPANEYVDILLREKKDVSFCELQYPAFAGVLGSLPDIILFEDDFSTTSGVLFNEEFGPNALDKYTILDQGNNLRPSLWTVEDNTIRQTRGIYGGSVITPLEAPGTMAITGDENWGNIQITAQLTSADNDAIGIVFCFKDEKNYYRFSMDSEKHYRRLVKIADSILTVLWEDERSYVVNVTYKLVIQKFNGQIIGYINDILLFIVNDITLYVGRVGFYCWRNSNALFEKLQIDSLSTAPLLFDSGSQENFLSIVDADGAIGGPSEWVYEAGHFIQKSNIRSLGTAIESLGTFAMLTNDMWEDATIHARVRSLDNDEIGIMFKVNVDDSSSIESAYNYYRFSMNRQAGRRMLIKKYSNNYTLLWQDDFTYTIDEAYDITIKTLGEKITIYFNGQILIETADDELIKGTLALYCYANANAIFDKIIVTDTSRLIGGWKINDEGIIGAPSIWGSKNGELRQEAPIHSNDFPAALGTYLTMPSKDWKSYVVTARLKIEREGAIGILFRYKDSQNYYRFSMDSQRSYRRIIKMKNGVATVLDEALEPFEAGHFIDIKIDAIRNQLKVIMDEEVILKAIDDDLPAGGIALYNSFSNGVVYSQVRVKVPAIEAYTLFQDNFLTNDLSAWQVIDLGSLSAPSHWEIENGLVKQSSNIYNNEAITAIEKKGTMLVAGDASWENIIFTARIKSSDNDEIGLVFRYNDNLNYYRFTMNKQAKFRRLTRVSNGVSSILWEDNFDYLQNEFYTISIVAGQDTIRAYTNDLLTLSIMESEINSGKIGLFSWANTGSFYSQVKVYTEDLIEDNYLLHEKFETDYHSNWEIIDEGTVEAPSDWISESGALVQKTNIRGVDESSTDPDKPGTYALNNTIFNKNIRITAVFSSSDNDAIGLMFGYIDATHYYRFSMDSQRNYQRLIQRNGEDYITLWENLTDGYNENFRNVLSIDFSEGIIIGYLNGIKLVEYENEDVEAKGKIALYCWANINAYFYEVIVQESTWYTLYRFNKEERFSDGTHFRLYSGNKSNAVEDIKSIQQRYIANFEESGFIRFRNNQQLLRIAEKSGHIIHTKKFLRNDLYTEVQAKIVRKRDGTKFFLFPTIPGEDLQANDYRLSLKFRRDNTAYIPESQVLRQIGASDEEKASIDI